MDPSKWGPVTWRVLHGLVEKYVPALHMSYNGLFYSLAATLPCRKCRNNYVLKLLQRPFPCDRSKVVIRNWLIDVHNAVNRDLDKPVLSRRKAIQEIKPLKQVDVKRMLQFIELNLKQNNPPSSYRVGFRILRTHLAEILSVVTSMSMRPLNLTQTPHPRVQRGR